jgi:RNA polymerase sigma-70 factor (ECF subfamily)
MTDTPSAASLPNHGAAEALAALAARDVNAALAEVARAHRRSLERHAASILRNEELAADAVQDVLIKAMREPRFFDAAFNRGAWLHRVTRNLCLNRVRDRRRRGDLLAALPADNAHEASQPHQVLDRERHAVMRAALSRLSRHHREILEERFYRDLSYAEIAEVLDIKLGTVMSRLSRAKTALLDILDPGSAEAL